MERQRSDTPKATPRRASANARDGRARWHCSLAAVSLLRSTAWESTDNAQIDGYIYPITLARVGLRAPRDGRREPVRRGGYGPGTARSEGLRGRRRQRPGDVANSEASAAALRTNVPITSTNTASQLSSAEADVANAHCRALPRRNSSSKPQWRRCAKPKANDLKAQDDVERYRPLAEKDEIPQQQFTQAVNSQRATAAAVEAARASAAAAEQAVTQARARLAQAQAHLRSAEPAASRSPLNARAHRPRTQRRNGPRLRCEQAQTQSAVRHHRRAGQRHRRRAIGAAGSERVARPAADVDRAARQQEHLGHRQLQGDAVEVHASRPAGDHLGRRVRPHVPGARAQHRRRQRRAL